MNARRAATIGAQPLRGVRSAPAPAPRPRVNWTALGVVATALGVAATLAAQAAAVFLWAGGMSSRVERLEKQTAALAGVPAQLATLDERSQAQGEALKHLVAVEDGQREDTALAQAVRRWAHADSGRRRQR